jgi:hypothetical protein
MVGDNIKFICRIKALTKQAIIETKELATDRIVFFDELCCLEKPGQPNRKPLRLVGNEVDKVKY